MLRLIFLPQKAGQQRNAVDSSWLFFPQNICESRQPIPECGNVIRRAPRCDLPRPFHDHRHVNASLIKVSFVPAKWSIGIEELGICSAFPMGAVVGGKDDEGIFGKPELLELVYHFADKSVRPFYHCRKSRMRIRM